MASLILEERQREDLVRVGQALEALNGYEAFHLIKQGPQFGCDVEVDRLSPVRSFDLKYDGYHSEPPKPCGAEASFRKVRSSRSRNPSFWANS